MNRASEALDRRISDLIALRVANAQPDAELNSWIETLPGRLREKLQETGLLDRRTAAASKPLDAHVDDWRAALKAMDTTAKHADLVTGRARRAFDCCGFTFWSNLSASKLQT